MILLLVRAPTIALLRLWPWVQLWLWAQLWLWVQLWLWMLLWLEARVQVPQQSELLRFWPRVNKHFVHRQWRLKL
jgi:hypothetical protein